MPAFLAEQNFVSIKLQLIVALREIVAIDDVTAGIFDGDGVDGWWNEFHREMINVRSISLSNRDCSHQWQTSNIGNRKRRNSHLFSRKAWTTTSEPVYRPT